METCKEIKLATEYGRGDAINDMKGIFESATKDKKSIVEIKEISLENYEKLLLEIKETYGSKVVIVNLCDGTESDGYPV